jgi:phosphatidylserine decarboxylase
VFAPGAGRWIGPPVAATVVLAILVASGLGRGFVLVGLVAVLLIALGFAIFLAVFLRDPDRAPGVDIVSAADGRVREVAAQGERLLVSVFMNVTDVHVNRLPLDGTLVRVEDAGRGYAPAYRPDARSNVQRRYHLSTGLGPVEVVQITGAVARRLVAFRKPGWAGRKGDRLGMIVLGSRVDVLLPAARVVALVAVGDRVIAGSTSIARERP